MTAEGHLFFSIACAVFAKNAELTPVLAQGDWWHIVPYAVLTCLLPDIDHPKSFLGLQTGSPRLRPSRFYPQSTGGIRRAGAVLPKSTGELDYPGGCAAGFSAWLPQPYTRRYAHPGRRTAAVALPLAVPPADPRTAQRQSARARAVHGAVHLRRLDAAKHCRK